MILTSSFYNHSWTQNQGSAWLDELQTHGWNSKTSAFIFLQPWSKGNFSNKELKEQERSLHIFSTGFPPIFHNHVSQWQLECEFKFLWAGGMEVASVVGNLEFLLPLGKKFHWFPKLTSPHHKTELHPLWPEVEARP
ncbi:unnamed protein product [Gulo gulo]|uniref:MHC class I-like antigen recognition-like domain-containing protein n=1 Tax=Gulo gulo TaxID=48420 RepID=A0A9X9LTH2_GULGU|nr:unnamed protein product [Gulo gulo]